MGNCWPAPVANRSTPRSTKPLTPVPNYAERSEKSKSTKSRGSPPQQETRGGGGSVAAAEEVPPSGRIVTPNLKMYTYAELKNATRNFRPDTVLGEGGFGTVFKGWVDEKTHAPSKAGVGMPVAVKRSNPDSSQGLKEWQAEVKFLGKFSHPNLVKLLGYCWEDRQFLLVYEHMQKGSLESHLFRRGSEPLSWETRLKIAIGASRGLAFLHTTEKQVIYRDFKSSNILLDANFNAKLSDFGLAKLGPMNGDSHVTTGIVGTYGYAAPEYMATGHLYINSDVYAFGVVLLEIITGRRVLDMERPSGQQDLVQWARPLLLHDMKKLKKILDPHLMDQYPSKSALFQTAELILKCLESDPKHRPPMDEVLETLQKIETIKMKGNESKYSTKHNKELKFSAKHNNNTASSYQRSPENYRPYGHNPNRSPLHGGGGTRDGGSLPLPRPKEKLYSGY